MINLDRPRDGDTHTIADFAELLCLLTPGRNCSREDISDHIRDEGLGRIDVVELDDCFNQISWRVAAFGEHYPFVMNERNTTFNSTDELTEPQKIYVFLLLCSNFPFIENWSPLADAFERLAVEAYKSFWPTSAIVKAFGKNTTDYIGLKWERINKLAQDIGGIGLCSGQTFRQGDDGDAGIDLVAWNNLDSYEARNIPSALAQCGCSRSGWAKKQTEISRDRLNGMIHPSSPWMQLMFIPHCFRDNRGQWAVMGQISSCIIYDRLRLILSLDTDQFNLQAINPPALLDEFLAYRRSIV